MTWFIDYYNFGETIFSTIMGEDTQLDELTASNGLSLFYIDPRTK